MQINILSENEIKEIVKEELRKDLAFLYQEIDNCRNKLNDLENLKLKK